MKNEKENKKIEGNFYIHSWEQGSIKAVSVIRKDTEEVVTDFTVGEEIDFQGEKILIKNRPHAKKLALKYIKKLGNKSKMKKQKETKKELTYKTFKCNKCDASITQEAECGDNHTVPCVVCTKGTMKECLK